MGPVFISAEDSGISLTLNQAITRALSNNPEIASFAFEINKAQGRIIQAGLMSNPDLSLEIENIAGTGDFRNFKSAEGTLLISQEIQLGNKRDKRKKAFQSEKSLIYWDNRLLKLELIKKVSLAFYKALGAQEILIFNEELVRLSEKVHITARERAQAGKISPLEEIKSKANLAIQNIELKNAEKELYAARNELAALWGGDKFEYNKVEGDIYTLSPLLSLEELKNRISSNPDLFRWDLEREHRKAIMESEKAQYLPNLEIGGGIRKFKETDAYAYVVELSLPLMLSDRNQGTIEESSQRLNQSDKEYLAAKAKALKELDAAYREATASFNEAATLKNEIIPGLALVFNSMQEGYLIGKFSYLEVMDSQRTYYEINYQYLSSLINYHLASIEIERLVSGCHFDQTSN